MPYHYADNQTYESCEEATGREYLFREVCGAAALPAGEGGTIGGRSGGSPRNQLQDCLQLGTRAYRTQNRPTTDFVRNIGTKNCWESLSQALNSQFYKTVNAPLDTISQFCRISPVNLMGRIPNPRTRYCPPGQVDAKPTKAERVLNVYREEVRT